MHHRATRDEANLRAAGTDRVRHVRIRRICRKGFGNLEAGSVQHLQVIAADELLNILRRATRSTRNQYRRDAIGFLQEQGAKTVTDLCQGRLGAFGHRRETEVNFREIGALRHLTKGALHLATVDIDMLNVRLGRTQLRGNGKRPLNGSIQVAIGGKLQLHHHVTLVRRRHKVHLHATREVGKARHRGKGQRHHKEPRRTRHPLNRTHITRFQPLVKPIPRLQQARQEGIEKTRTPVHRHHCQDWRQGKGD